MPVQDYINSFLDLRRKLALNDSPQLTLGVLIQKLDVIEDKSQTVVFDFDSVCPTTLDSWRGSYAELALGYVDYERVDQLPCVSTLLDDLRSAIGKTYEGWKGGEFQMGKNTPIWVANPGFSGDIGIVGVLSLDGRVVLQTAQCEY